MTVTSIYTKNGGRGLRGFQCEKHRKQIMRVSAGFGGFWVTQTRLCIVPGFNELQELAGLAGFIGESVSNLFQCSLCSSLYVYIALYPRRRPKTSPPNPPNPHATWNQ
jgi:hypothetical protein